ncbi:MAG: GNAT family N-acetyltransferase [Cyanobacteria bacterium REEB67]|nr:GNAT family N-acetyltransferase [Cyanobacteria bacterium REEB67]
MTINIKALSQDDLLAATRVCKIAFSAQLGISNPDLFNAGASLGARLALEPNGNYGAFDEEQLVGSIFSANWGSVGYFGPLTVLPEYWGQGIAQKLLEPVMGNFAAGGTTCQGLFTFSNSPKHIALYQKFGFYPRFLTAIMSKSVTSAIASNNDVVTYSSLGPQRQIECLEGLSAICDDLYVGLDLSKEVLTLESLRCGETVLLLEGESPVGFAVCHFGPGSEAENGGCYLKFAAVKRGDDAARHFRELIQRVDHLIGTVNVSKIVAGINLARQGAYESLLALHFRPFTYGVLMQRPNVAAYDRPDCFVIDDWR